MKTEENPLEEQMKNLQERIEFLNDKIDYLQDSDLLANKVVRDHFEKELKQSQSEFERCKRIKNKKA